MTCSVSGCEKEAKEKGMCWAHVKQERRGKTEKTPVRGYRMPIHEKLGKAATRYANAEDDIEYVRASKLLAKYASGNGAQKRLRTMVEEIVHATLKKLLGQVSENENVRKPADTRRQG